MTESTASGENVILNCSSSLMNRLKQSESKQLDAWRYELLQSQQYSMDFNEHNCQFRSTTTNQISELCAASSGSSDGRETNLIASCCSCLMSRVGSRSLLVSIHRNARLNVLAATRETNFPARSAGNLNSCCCESCGSYNSSNESASVRKRSSRKDIRTATNYHLQVNTMRICNL